MKLIENTPPAFGSHPSTRGELNRVGYQWSVVGEFFKDTLSRKGILYLPISHFPLTHLYSVNGFGEPCRSSDQFFIEEEFYLLISHFLLTHLL